MVSLGAFGNHFPIRTADERQMRQFRPSSQFPVTERDLHIKLFYYEPSADSIGQSSLDRSASP
jgi:hypothetical protein